MLMVAYVNGVHPLVGVFDGFFIHSRGSRVMPTGGAEEEGQNSSGGCSSSTQRPFEGTAATIIRDDLPSSTKVFEFLTEGDVIGVYGYQAVRQPDSDTYHSWEVAGASHVDRYVLELNKDNPLTEGVGMIETCSEIANTGPHHLVIKAALHALHAWMIDGTNSPTAEPMQTDAYGNGILDEHDNGLGGIRTPHVDVPIATLKTEMTIFTNRPMGCDASISERMCGVF